LLDADIPVEVDMIERLPTPWGLVRAGVAPDHPEKKLIVDRHFEFAFKNPRVRFFGNVEIGRDIHHDELTECYDAVIYAVGADSDARMGIPGEELSGCWSAREFVAFYNGHPDYSRLKFDLSCNRAVVVGNGNVALDVARVLTMPPQELERTDIADYALNALRASDIQEVVILGRRGHLEASFSNPELEELEHLQGVDVIFDGKELREAQESDSANPDLATVRKANTMRRLAARPSNGRNKRIVFRFLTSPIELFGERKVERIRVMRNQLERDDKGHVRARPTEDKSILDAGLVLRAIGYRGSPFPGLPFDRRRGVIQNIEGRVADNGRILAGAYVTGWIKRGCRGIIGSNKKCSDETIQRLFEDIETGRLTRTRARKEDVLSLVEQRQPNCVSRRGWLSIDRVERTAGRAQRRPRVKITNNGDLLQCAFAGSLLDCDGRKEL